MLLRLLILFVTVPLVELAILLRLANRIGGPGTLLLVIATGLAGAALARRQGWTTYVRIQRELQSGHMPAESLIDAAMIFVAGAFLLTPGVLTDLAGLTLLVPRCRRFYRQRIAAWVRSHFQIHTLQPRDDDERDRIIDCRVPPTPEGREGPA